MPIGRDYGNKADFKKESFGAATQNWMNFQPSFKTDDTFKTTAQCSFSGMEERKEPFALRQTGLTADQAKLEEYRAKYTGGNHNFNRTYLGAATWKKSDQES